MDKTSRQFNAYRGMFAVVAKDSTGDIQERLDSYIIILIF